ncbi:MAG: Crp/Fnr family transcriptional regulator [Enterocloster sp.]
MKTDSRVRIPGFIQEGQNAYYYRKLGETVRIKAGTLITYPGDVPKYCYFIRKGRVFAGIVDHAGTERILFSFEQNSIFLEQYLLTGGCSNLFFAANTDVVAQKITYPELVQAMKSHFTVTLDIIHAMNGFSETVLRRVAGDLNETAAVRICNLLIEMAELFGEEENGKTELEIKIRQDIIGRLTGLHRVTVTREINKLKEQKLLTIEEGRYCITDMESFVQYRNKNSLSDEKG